MDCLRKNEQVVVTFRSLPPLAPGDVEVALSAWSLAVAIISMIVGAVVAVLLYRLGRRLDFRGRMQHWDAVRSQVQAQLARVRTGEVSSDLILINAKRYDDFDGGNDWSRHGYQQLKVELEDLRFNGVRVITQGVQTYYDKSRRRTTRQTATPAPGAVEIGLVPFDWIEHVTLGGNEYNAASSLVVRFKGKGHRPFRSYSFTEATPSGSIGPLQRAYYPEATVRQARVTLRERIGLWRVRRRLNAEQRKMTQWRDRNG